MKQEDTEYGDTIVRRERSTRKQIFAAKFDVCTCTYLVVLLNLELSYNREFLCALSFLLLPDCIFAWYNVSIIANMLTFVYVHII